MSGTYIVQNKKYIVQKCPHVLFKVTFEEAGFQSCLNDINFCSSYNIVGECIPGVTKPHHLGRRLEAGHGHRLHKYMVQKINLRLQTYVRQLARLHGDKRPLLWKHIHVSTWIPNTSCDTCTSKRNILSGGCQT